MYGSTPAGVAFQLGIEETRAIELINMYFNAYPLIKVFINDAHMMAVANQYVITPFGQKKWEFGTMKEYKYTAAYNACKRNAQNVLIQSTTSSLGLFCFAALNEKIKELGGKNLCSVYDSCELEIPINRLAEAIELGFYYMNDYPQEDFDWLDFPIGADAEIGPNWGTLHGVKRGITQEQVMGVLSG